MWAEFLASLKFDDVATAGIVAFAIFLILTGKLTPKAVTDDVRSERDAWKQAYMDSSEANNVKDTQIAELLEVARVANHVISSLPQVGGGSREVAQKTEASDGSTGPVTGR